MTRDEKITTLDSLSYSDIDLNLCWAYDPDSSTKENYVFSVLASCEQTPTILIENPDGKFKLQFGKEDSVIKLTNNQVWYRTRHLISKVEIP